MMIKESDNHAYKSPQISRQLPEPPQRISTAGQHPDLRGKHLVVTEKQGRLGNQLFLFAHLLAYARATGCTVINPSFWKYSHFFVGTHSDPLCRIPQVREAMLSRTLLRPASRLSRQLVQCAKQLPVFKTWIKSIDASDRIVDLGGSEFEQFFASADWLSLYGWCFRFYAGVEAHAEAVRSHFRPIEKHWRKVNQKLEVCREGSDVCVGVHIRHGDFRDWHNGSFFRSVAQFKRVMRHTRELFLGQRVRFLVCSDERLSASDFSDFDFQFGTGQIIEDLYSLVRCDYLIGPPESTFSGWASFYGATPLFRIEDPNQRPDLDGFKIVQMSEEG